MRDPVEHLPGWKTDMAGVRVGGKTTERLRTSPGGPRLGEAQSTSPLPQTKGLLTTNIFWKNKLSQCNPPALKEAERGIQVEGNFMAGVCVCVGGQAEASCCRPQPGWDTNIRPGCGSANHCTALLFAAKLTWGKTSNADRPVIVSVAAEPVEKVKDVREGATEQSCRSRCPDTGLYVCGYHQVLVDACG